MASASSPNSLGLDFNQLQIQEQPSTTQQEEPIEAPNIPSPGDSPQILPEQQKEDSTEVKIKKKAYVNPERVKTGGNQRDKLSEEELAERMARMREQNEKIKQRRMDVQADEAAFRKTQESERAKLAQIRKVQETVDRTREQNAKRKMDKIQSREWDSGKPTGDWKRQADKPESGNNVTTNTDEKGSSPPESSSPSREVDRRLRGGGFRGASQRGRGRVKGQSGSGAAQGSEGFPTNSSSTISRDNIETSQSASS